MPRHGINQKNQPIGWTFGLDDLVYWKRTYRQYPMVATERDRSTEERIFTAAREVFQEVGFTGTRMQAIADRAGINKSMLHYYYRSKDMLFEAVFRDSALRVMPLLVESLKRDGPLVERIRTLVYAYMDLLAANPHLPGFLVFELQREPKRLRAFMSEQAGSLFTGLRNDIERSVTAGEIRSIDPVQLVVNVIALCVFPFVARPILQEVAQMDDAAFARFIEERKDQVYEFVLRAIAP